MVTDWFPESKLRSIILEMAYITLFLLQEVNIRRLHRHLDPSFIIWIRSNNMMDTLDAKTYNLIVDGPKRQEIADIFM